MVDRRHYVRKTAKLLCALDLYAGASFGGYTSNLSFDGAMMESSLGPGMPGPKVGELGVFTLNFRNSKGSASLKMPCRVAHVMASSFGLQLMSSGLNKLQREQLTELLDGLK